MRAKVAKFVATTRFQWFITGLIIVNAAILGLETAPNIIAKHGWLLQLDQLILGVFVVEIALRIYAHGWRFFKDPWGIFDFTVVAVALVPATGPFSVVRALRVLRVLRLVSVVPSMRAVIEALLGSLPGLGAIMALLGLVFYVAAVMATNLFGADFPDWFGTLGRSLFSLFQIMTLESWSMGIVRPVLEVQPYAWIFFVGFILVATFTMLNLFIAVVVNAMQTRHEQEQGMSDREALATAHEERDLLYAELKLIRQELARIRSDAQSIKRANPES